MADVGSYTVRLGLRGLADAQSGLGRLGSSLLSAGRFAAIGVAGITAVGAAAATVVVPAVRLAAEAESLGVAMRVLVGDVAEATRVMNELREVGAKTPLQFEELARAAKSLISFGEPTETVVQQLVRIGNIATGIGEPINEIAVIFGKARVQGRLFAQDVNQLVGRGIPVIQEFAKQLGVADSEVKQMVAEGAIGFENLERAFVSLTSGGGKFEGLMEEMSTTSLGLYSTLKDNLNEQLRELGQEILPSITAALGLTGVGLESTKGSFAGFGEMIEGLLPTLGQLVDFLQIIPAAYNQLSIIFNRPLGVIAQVGSNFIPGIRGDAVKGFGDEVFAQSDLDIQQRNRQFNNFLSSVTGSGDWTAAAQELADEIRALRTGIANGVPTVGR